MTPVCLSWCVERKAISPSLDAKLNKLCVQFNKLPTTLKVLNAISDVYGTEEKRAAAYCDMNIIDLINEHKLHRHVDFECLSELISICKSTFDGFVRQLCPSWILEEHIFMRNTLQSCVSYVKYSVAVTVNEAKKEVCRLHADGLPITPPRRLKIYFSWALQLCTQSRPLCENLRDMFSS